MKNKKHIGSTFESFLEKEGIFEEVNVAAVKAIIALNLKKHMNRLMPRGRAKKADKI